MRCHQYINEHTKGVRLVFWKDRKECERYYCRRNEGTPESEKHSVDLAMEYGSNIFFADGNDVQTFLLENKGARVA